MNRAHAVPDDGRLLKPAEAAARLNIPLPLLRRIARGKHGLTALRYGNGRLIGFYERHIDDWKQQHLTVRDERQDRQRDVDRWVRAQTKTLYFPT